MRALGKDFKTLKDRNCSQESESVAIRNLLGGKVEIS